jgi:hypothetical protein
MIAAGEDERGRLATVLLLSDVLHCAALEINFSGCGALIDGEEMSRQLLITHRSFTDDKKPIDLQVSFFSNLPSGRTAVLPDFPEHVTEMCYPI